MNTVSAEFVRGIRGTDPVAYNGVPQVAFVGRSNVGKSSLVAAIAQRKNLVKVSNVPGKTREINFFLINKKYYLVDLPGYGYAKVPPKEKDKLKKLLAWYLTDSGILPKMVVIVLDVKVGITVFDEQMIEALRAKQHPFIIAANKTDKLSQKELAAQLKEIREAALGADVVPVSAFRGTGVPGLFSKLFA